MHSPLFGDVSTAAYNHFADHRILPLMEPETADFCFNDRWFLTYSFVDHIQATLKM